MLMRAVCESGREVCKHDLFALGLFSFSRMMHCVGGTYDFPREVVGLRLVA